MTLEMDQFALDAWQEDERSASVDVLADVEPGFLQQLLDGAKQASRLGVFERFCKLFQRPDVRWLVHSSVESASSAARIEVAVRAGSQYGELLAALRAGDRDGFLALCAAHGGTSL